MVTKRFHNSMSDPPRRLGEILLELGYLTEASLMAVLDEGVLTGQKTGQVALDRGLITEEHLMTALAKQYGLEVVDLENERPEQQAVKMVPQRLASAFNVLPWCFDDGTLSVVISDPTQIDWLTYDFTALIPHTVAVKPMLGLPNQVMECRKLAYLFDDDWYERRELINEANFMRSMPATLRRALWPRIFISYRRNDSEFQAHSIYEMLTKQFGSEVFIDVDDIPAGVDFPDFLDDTISQCDLVLALVSYHWMGPKSPRGQTRLHDPEDFVRIEIESALAKDIPVIPVLLGEVTMPQKDELPRSLIRLSYRNAIQLHARTFRHDLTKLSETITDTLGTTDHGRVLAEATFDLDRYRIQPSVLREIPPPFARRFNVVPLLQTKDRLFLATGDPDNAKVIARLKRLVNTDVMLIGANPDDVRSAVHRYYRHPEEED